MRIAVFPLYRDTCLVMFALGKGMRACGEIPNAYSLCFCGVVVGLQAEVVGRLEAEIVALLEVEAEGRLEGEAEGWLEGEVISNSRDICCFRCNEVNIGKDASVQGPYSCSLEAVDCI